MKYYNFEYDGLSLNDLGYTICSFGSDDQETISNGSQISFNTLLTQNGAKSEMTSFEYDNCIEATFQICKYTCDEGVEEMTFEDCNYLTNWLNRKKFLKLKFYDEEGHYSNLFFEASFNVSRIEISDRIMGLELTMLTNRPFALREPISKTITFNSNNEINIIHSHSDEEGYIYPEMQIELLASGDLEIINQSEGRLTSIKNCQNGEIITMNYPIIESSLVTHKIQNDFNWNFFRINNTFRNNTNKISTSIPCIINLLYSPIVKMGI